MITRTFHPIGQGAFYTEKHDHGNNKRFNVVYDCGSTTLRAKELKRRIKSVFQQGEEIDILFISHFHTDHINGIGFLKEYCTIKNVIVPFLSERSKTALKIENNTMYPRGASYNQLIDNPTTYFPDSFVITIRTFEEGNTESPVLNIEDLSKRNEKEFNSTVKITIGKWIYIPFNFKQEERCKQFETELKKHSLTLEDLTTIENIIEHSDAIKEAFENIDGELNENSMVVYSGPINEHIKNLANLSSKGRRCFYYDHFSSCIYTGDFNGRSITNVNALTNFVSTLKHPIGILQIPHHGSAKNFSENLMKLKPEHCVISTGHLNQYSHPSHTVLHSLIRNHIYYTIVTEHLDTILMQLIYIP
jgi:beta-lactamase superfamily II metal-dependent hydrolase